MTTKATGKKLTPKQLHFCRCLAGGATQAAAYREAYDVSETTKQATVYEAASRLMRKAEIRARVERLIEEKDRAIRTAAVSDREKVLAKLRAAMDPERDAEGNVLYASASELKAAELLGRSVGLFKDVIEDGRKRGTEEIEGEIERKLLDLLGDDGSEGTEPSDSDTAAQGLRLVYDEQDVTPDPPLGTDGT